MQLTGMNEVIEPDTANNTKKVIEPATDDAKKTIEPPSFCDGGYAGHA